MITIKKPKFDDRTFVGSNLDNNIKYACVNDLTLDKSYVSIAVNIGSYNEFKDHQGIAHFLEHMLFMGSKKYPDEDYYIKRLSELGGNFNAYTTEFVTVYYFGVYNNGLLEMFDILSRFFIDPLFNKSSVDREINAVNSEHEKNMNSDGWRLNQFIREISDSDSIINNFGTGNLKTLKKPDIREKLIEFYNKYYIPSNISIAIASSIEIKDQIKIIQDTFGNVINNKISNNLSFIQPYFKKNSNAISIILK